MRVTSIKLTLAVLAAISAFTLALPRNAARASECDFNAPLQNLAAIQNNAALADHDRLVAELNLRKQILGDVVGCAIRDASALKTSLANTSPADVQNARLATQLTNRIDDSLRYYDLRRSMIGDLGLQGTKDFSNEIEAWRKNTEAPLEAQISAFLLWKNNQPLLDAAKTRLAQITPALVGLDLSTSGGIPKDINDAKTELAAAADFNQKADTLIASGDSSGAITDIAQFLGALKSAYQDFFSLSDSVEKALAPK